ncbi:MAG: SpoIID/LytB domain-containing protein [Pseudomonadota bacterium]
MKSSFLKIRRSFFIIFISFCVMFLSQVLSPYTSIAGMIRVLIIDDKHKSIPEKDEKLIKVGNKTESNYLANGVYYAGKIEVWKGKNGRYFINELPLEDYVKDVVIAEVGRSWDIEAIKAQAVITRTYALYHKKAKQNSCYHLTSSVLHQTYKGNSPDPKITYAVEETSGEILTYDGEPIEALYHSTCGGKTELPEEVFGKSYSYLKSVESNCESSPYWEWKREIPLVEIEKGLNISGIKEIEVKSYTSTGRVKELEIKTESDQIIIGSNEFRKLLGWQRIPSTNFSIIKNSDSIVFEGKGHGHGIGLCQWSALEMAKEGKSYREILSFFYPGTEIQLYKEN